MKSKVIELKNVSKAFAEQTVLQDISLEIRHGEFLTLLGPSGCGKTTVLRLIAGFEKVSSGEIYIDGEKVNHLPANQRNVCTVFQSYALFPHMNVFENVAFGLRVKKMDKQQVEKKVKNVLSMVQLEDFALRKPHQLSGGQQQRIAIARAVVNDPLVLVLDEPLSALDYKLRKEMQLELKRLQRHLGITFIFVTHDQEEALSMSDRIIVLNKGKIEQVGTPTEIYEQPASLFVAEFIGETNIFSGHIKEIQEKTLDVNIDGLDCQLSNPGKNFIANQKINVVIRPEDFRLYNAPQKMCFKGKITQVVYKGSIIDVIVKLHNDKIITVSEFFNGANEHKKYECDQEIVVGWVNDGEVILNGS